MLDYNFCTRFADISINGSDLKLELYREADKLILSRHEVRFIKDYENKISFHSILYWQGYDAAPTSSNRNVFELNAKILKKIVTFLDENAMSSFYQSCVRAQQLVTEHLKENVFHCAVTPTKCTSENVFMVLGEHIRRMYIYMEHIDDEDTDGTPSHELKSKFMKCVNQYCGNSLMEMKIIDSVQSDAMLYWPHLRKLKFDMIDNLKLQRFHCPELTHLVIDAYYNHNVSNVSIDWLNSFPNLTNLTFDASNVGTFVRDLNRTLCSQINSLSLKRMYEKMDRCSWLKLTNIICRFERLATLHLNVNGIEKSNFRFLFEKCSMLEELLISHDDTWTNRGDTCVELFRTIKVNCTQLKILKLVGKRSSFWQSSSLKLIYGMFPNSIIILIKK